MHSTPSIWVLAGESSTIRDQAFAKFARFLGLEAKVVTLSNESDEAPSMRSVPNGSVLALHGTTLARLLQHPWGPAFLDDASLVFTYGFSPTAGESPELKRLTGGAIPGVSAIRAPRLVYTVPATPGKRALPVTGKSFVGDGPDAAAFSVTVSDPSIEYHVTVNGQPCLVSLRHGSTLMFLATTPDLPDIDTPLSPAASLRPWYFPLVAATIFLRTAFGPWCWTSPVTSATFIVDDPYLKKRYGFVRYETLATELARTGAALTVAFIPYNHRRSDLQTVSRLRSFPDRFSIAVHGCDHTGGEFQNVDAAWMAGTTACALERMEDHTRRTGMPFDNVMVFPQGRFSTTAIGALKSRGLFAAVNSTVWPRDWQAAPLTLRDLLDVAVTRYERFPIFVRHYPKDVFDYAFDALFQKPVFAVEHHGFFRQGYGGLTDLVEELATIEPKVQWMPLGRAVASSCVIRKTGDDKFKLRQFAPCLRFQNPTAAPLTLSVEKPETEGLVEAVLVGSRKVPFEVKSGRLQYVVLLSASEELQAQVLYRPAPRVRRHPSLKYRIGAAARRRLSDLRDNHLSRSERLLAVANSAKKLFTGRKS